jgi:thioredoxin 1
VDFGVAMLSGLLEYFKNNPFQFLFAVYLGFKVYQYLTQAPYDDSAGPEKIESLNDWNTLLNSNEDRVIVVDFYAIWCGPCKVAAPRFAKLAEEAEFSSVIFRKCNVDTASDVSRACGVRVMPTFKVFYGKKEVLEMTGYQEERLKEAIRNALKSK